MPDNPPPPPPPPGNQLRNALGLSTAATQLIPNYSGEDSVRTFLSYVEDVSELEGWNEVQKVKVARLKLQGPARRLVEWNEELKSPACTWIQLKNALIQRFEKKVMPVEQLHRFRSCTQREGESVTEFAERLQMLGAATMKKTADPNRNEWIRAQLLEECLVQFLEGLNTAIQYKVMSSAPRTFEEAVEIALREEQIATRLRRKTLQRAIDAEESKFQDTQENIQPRQQRQFANTSKFNSNQQSENFKCWGCGQKGHTRANCKNCFECGRSKNPWWASKQGKFKREQGCLQELGGSPQLNLTKTSTTSQNLVCHIMLSSKFNSISLNIEGTIVKALIDTGSDISLVKYSELNSNQRQRITESDLILRDVQGTTIKNIGKVKLTVKIGKTKRAIHQFIATFYIDSRFSFVGLKRQIEKEDASKKIEASHLQVVQKEEKEKSLITNESEGQGDFPGEVEQPDEGKHPQSHTGPKAGRIDPKETFMEGSCNNEDGEHSQSHTDPTAGGIGPQNTVISSQEMNINRKEGKQCVYVEDGRKKKEMRKETEGGGTTKADNEVIEGTEVWNAKYVTDPTSYNHHAQVQGEQLIQPDWYPVLQPSPEHPWLIYVSAQALGATIPPGPWSVTWENQESKGWGMSMAQNLPITIALNCGVNYKIYASQPIPHTANTAYTRSVHYYPNCPSSNEITENNIQKIISQVTWVLPMLAILTFLFLLICMITTRNLRRIKRQQKNLVLIPSYQHFSQGTLTSQGSGQTTQINPNYDVPKQPPKPVFTWKEETQQQHPEKTGTTARKAKASYRLSTIQEEDSAYEEVLVLV
ncbi:hypothetical protein TcasGA2_TC005160 [Tribolium castaneum]|uniref:CCHC-type domain-containing protein n=1 Tax=Tribolium castaneum TaxID=7070 RepID=D7ELT0_TRICA|nr:hypothetical protein TcasGA2_TC005160 [Tribolium castaneum]